MCALQMSDLVDRDNGRFSEHRFLSAMLSMAQRFEKTEASDSVYAILGLIDQDKTLGGDEAALLEVNHMKSLPDVLRDATRVLKHYPCSATYPLTRTCCCSKE